MDNPVNISVEKAVKRFVEDQVIAGQVSGLLSVLIQLALYTGILIGIFICVVGLFIYAGYDVQEDLKVLQHHVNELRAKQ